MSETIAGKAGRKRNSLEKSAFNMAMTISLLLLAVAVPQVYVITSTIRETKRTDGMLPCSVGMRLLERMRGSVVCLRITVLRVRMRALGSVCAVISGMRGCGARLHSVLCGLAGLPEVL